MLEVDAKDGRFGDAQVAREAGGDVDLLGVLVPPLEHDHGKDRRALCDVGERDHRPEHGSACLVDELQIDGIGHVVQAGDHERSVHGSKDGAKQDA